MSVTFRMNAKSLAIIPQDGQDDAAWEAYEEQKHVEGEFNVANANAAFIVRELLNLGDEDIYYGSLTTTEAKMRLKASQHKLTSDFGVKAPAENQAVHVDADGVSLGCRVIDCGRTREQVERYVRHLRCLIEVAENKGVAIVWG